MIMPLAEKISESPTIMNALFLVEVFLFIGVGLGISNHKFLFSFLYLIVGLGAAYILGKAIEERAVNLYKENENKQKKD